MLPGKSTTSSYIAATILLISASALSQFVCRPLVGDIVIFFPSGHYAFLGVFGLDIALVSIISIAVYSVYRNLDIAKVMPIIWLWAIVRVAANEMFIWWMIPRKLSHPDWSITPFSEILYLYPILAGLIYIWIFRAYFRAKGRFGSQIKIENSFSHSNPEDVEPREPFVGSDDAPTSQTEKAPSPDLPEASPSLVEDRAAQSGYYAQALDELESGNYDKADWARALARSEGNENQAESYYIQERTQTLMAKARSERPETKPPQEEIKSKKAPGDPGWVAMKKMVLWVGAAALVIWFLSGN